MAAIFFSSAINARRNNLRCCVRPPIGEALAADSLQGRVGTFGIAEPGLFPLASNLHFGFAVVIAEVKLLRITLQVLRADMVVDTIDAALEDRKVTFNRVGVCVAAHVFARAMVHNIVAGKHRRDKAVLAFAVRHQARFCGVQLRGKDRAQIIGIDGSQVHGAHLAATLDQREHHLFAHAADVLAVALAAVFVALFSAHIGFVRLHRSAASAEHPARSLHRFADAVRHEPRGLVLNAKRTLELVAGATLFAGADQVDRLHPLMQWNLGALKYSSHGHGELATAVLALHQPRTVRLALQRVVILAHDAAMRAYRAVRPTHGFKVFAGFVCVLELGFVQVARHVCFSSKWKQYA